MEITKLKVDITDEEELKKFQEQLELLIDLRETLREVMRFFAIKDSHVTENGDIELNKQWILEHVVKSGAIRTELEYLFHHEWDDLAEKVTYVLRKQWSDEKEKERALNQDLQPSSGG